MAEPARTEVDVEVRYAETDQMGVVHHAEYVVWFESPAPTSARSLAPATPRSSGWGGSSW